MNNFFLLFSDTVQLDGKSAESLPGSKRSSPASKRSTQEAVDNLKNNREIAARKGKFKTLFLNLLEYKHAFDLTNFIDFCNKK